MSIDVTLLDHDARPLALSAGTAAVLFADGTPVAAGRPDENGTVRFDVTVPDDARLTLRIAGA